MQKNKLLKNISFYKLNGIPGWSALQPDNIDVADVNTMTGGRRLFMIFNRNCPYELKILYSHIKDNVGTTNILNAGSMYHYTTFEQGITRRYETEAEMNDDIKNITQMQQKLSMYADKIRNDIKIQIN